MKLILTFCIQFIVTWNSLCFFIICEADYKSKLDLPQVTINHIQNVKISFESFLIIIHIVHKQITKTMYLLITATVHSNTF
jgi:hypothetical protein